MSSLTRNQSSLYRVNFKDVGLMYSILIPPGVSIDMIVNGFWVNKSNEFTLGADAHMYVMPHHIARIVKV